jgi:hypothetical protein
MRGVDLALQDTTAPAARSAGRLLTLSPVDIHSRYLFPKNESHAYAYLRRVVDQSYP